MCDKSSWLIRATVVMTVVLSGVVASSARAAEDSIGMSTGIKICEVDSDSAIIWMRLTRSESRVGSDRPMPEFVYRDPVSGEVVELREARQGKATPEVVYPEGANVETIEGAAPGAAGDVQVLYKRAGAANWLETVWAAVDPERDFTHQIELTDLDADTAYDLLINGRTEAGGKTSHAAKFRTAPAADAPAKVVFTVSTGQMYLDRDLGDDGFKIYPAMSKLDPSFFVHTGDILYYDDFAKNIELARWGWQRMYSLPTNVAFHMQTPSYFIKDDHDTWQNDCWPGMESVFMGDFTFEQGQAVYREQVGMGPSEYRTVRWGKDLQIWLVEGRNHRSPNDTPDGPEKTIWGSEQKAWFKKTVEASDAAFRILISPTPLVGPDRPNKADNHANAVFTHEGDELRAFIGDQKDMFVICGDRHWQYESQHPATGVIEFSCGPASDEHASGFSEDDRSPMHRYLRIIGGFLEVSVERKGDTPAIAFRHRSVDGELYHEAVFEKGRTTN